MTTWNEYDEPNDPCDYCGGQVSDSGQCARCEGDYRQGSADYRDYKDALLIGGEDLAAQMEMEAEYGYMG